MARSPDRATRMGLPSVANGGTVVSAIEENTADEQRINAETRGRDGGHLGHRSYHVFCRLCAAAVIDTEGRKHAAIERRFGKQLKKLAELGWDYEHINDAKRTDFKQIAQLFSDAAILEATVWSSNSLNKSGTGMKHGKYLPVGAACWFPRSPSIGKPVVNLWQGGGGQYIEYIACLVDQHGVERSYRIIVDLSKINAPED